MSRYYGGWAPYVPVADRRRDAERELEKLRKKGAPVAPIKIEGRTIAASFWGKAWCDNLESYRDYENRLERGRSYVRNGLVLDLQIASREVTALVSGSDIYKVKVTIGEVPKARWKLLCSDCSGGIDSLVELLQGRLSKGVMERLCRQDTGLFPRPSEIRFTCSCPDHASMCKHIAAVLYGVGARLDRSPELLFRLRAVDAAELLGNLGSALPGTGKRPDERKTLAGDDLAALFGLDMADGEAPAAHAPAGRRKMAKKDVPAKTAPPSTAGMPEKPGKKDKAAPRPAGKGKIVAARPKTKAEPAPSARPTGSGRKAPAKAPASASRSSISEPVIGTSVPGTEARSERSARPAVRRRIIGSKRHRPDAGT